MKLVKTLTTDFTDDTGRENLASRSHRSTCREVLDCGGKSDATPLSHAGRCASRQVREGREGGKNFFPLRPSRTWREAFSGGAAPRARKRRRTSPGVRPSSGAASLAGWKISRNTDGLVREDIAAPGDGRTPGEFCHCLFREIRGHILRALLLGAVLLAGGAGAATLTVTNRADHGPGENLGTNFVTRTTSNP